MSLLPSKVVITDGQGNPIAGSDGVIPAPPTPASAVGELAFDVGTSRSALAGTSPTGFTILNDSAAGQTIWLGGAAVTTSGAVRGFPLKAGAALDRAKWQNLNFVHAISNGSGASLIAVPL